MTCFRLFHGTERCLPFYNSSNTKYVTKNRIGESRKLCRNLFVSRISANIGIEHSTVHYQQHSRGGPTRCQTHSCLQAHGSPRSGGTVNQSRVPRRLKISPPARRQTNKFPLASSLFTYMQLLLCRHGTSNSSLCGNTASTALAG